MLLVHESHWGPTLPSALFLKVYPEDDLYKKQRGGWGEKVLLLVWSPKPIPRYAVSGTMLLKWIPRNLQVEQVFLQFLYRLKTMDWGLGMGGGGQGGGNVNREVFSDQYFQVLTAMACSYFLSFILLPIFSWLLLTSSE